jgi:hypothetical protein
VTDNTALLVKLCFPREEKLTRLLKSVGARGGEEKAEKEPGEEKAEELGGEEKPEKDVGGGERGVSVGVQGY